MISFLKCVPVPLLFVNGIYFFCLPDKDPCDQCFWHFLAMIDPLKPNGISNSYQLDQSISVLRIIGLYSNFRITICKQTVETQNAASGLGLYCLRMSHKKDARSIWVECFNPLSLASFLWDIGKQCRTRPDATERGVWPGSPLFAYKLFY